MAYPSPDPAAHFDWAAAERQLKNVSDGEPVTTEVASALPLPSANSSSEKYSSEIRPLGSRDDDDAPDPAPLHDVRVTLWRTFGIAQWVLWLTVVVVGRVRLLTDGDPASWMHVVAPVAVAVTVLVWAWRLRSTRGGLHRLPALVRGQRWLQLGLASHVLCLATLLMSFLLPGGAGQITFGAAVMFLLIASGAVWLHARRENSSTTG